MTRLRSKLICVIAGLAVTWFTATSLGEDWPKYRHDLANTGTSNEHTITSSNAATLKLKFKFSVGANITAAPAVATVNGTSMVFFGDWNGTFHALNAVTGAQVWSFQIDPISGCTQAPPFSCKVIGSSAAVATVNSQQLVYFGAHNGFLYALNPATGAVVWKTQLANPNQNFAVWSSPAVTQAPDGTTNVYVGLANAGNDAPCVAGQVVAVNASTGAVKWTFNTIDQTSCQGTGCAGAGVWTSAATGGNFVFFGTGNPATTCSPPTPNATRYPDSILSLDPSTGNLVSFFQAVANDNADVDFGSSPVLYSSVCPFLTFAEVFVSEPSKNGQLYTCSIGANFDTGVLSSCSGAVQDGSNVTASPVVQPYFARGLPGCPSPERGGNDRADWIYTLSTGGNLVSNFMNGAGQMGTPLIQASPTTSGSFSAPALEPANTFGTPAMIFFGAENGLFYAYSLPTNINSSNTAQLIFSFTTGGAIESGPAISNSRIYFGSNDGNLYCLSLNGQ